jgi:hypothetical protein
LRSSIASPKGRHGREQSVLTADHDCARRSVKPVADYPRHARTPRAIDQGRRPFLRRPFHDSGIVPHVALDTFRLTVSCKIDSVPVFSCLLVGSIQPTLDPRRWRGNRFVPPAVKLCGGCAFSARVGRRSGQSTIGLRRHLRSEVPGIGRTTGVQRS